MAHRPGDLAELTTLRVGGPAARVIEARSEEELVTAVTEADQAGRAVLLVAGGSNLLVADDGFDGDVVLVRTAGVEVTADACSGATVTVQAGESWDALVAMAVDRGWVGMEALSGIPGSVGATPMQNVGAYGQEVSQTVASVRAYDRHERRVRTLAAADCAFSYRHSRFKSEPGRWLLLSVTFQLRLGSLSAPVAYGELARRLGVEVGERAPLADVRRAVLALRSAKGMVLDPSDHDTWSAGSFFTNPVLDAETAGRLPPGAPRFPQPDGSIKSSAAWLIQHAGYSPGFTVGEGRAALSSKHTLALTNRGEASTADVLELARAVRDGVADAFGIVLVPEPVLVGCAL